MVVDIEQDANSVTAIYEVEASKQFGYLENVG
jgi:hypothetical protein